MDGQAGGGSDLTAAENMDLSALIDELSPENLKYATPTIFERRRRMLLVTRELIAERGYDGTTVREICARASVSPHTLYKVYEGKEQLVAVAIGSYFKGLYLRSSGGLPGHTLSGVLQHMIISDEQMLADRALTRAMISMHYSLGIAETVRNVTREKGRMIFAPWAEALFLNGHLKRSVAPADLVQDLTSLLFAVCWDWCRGVVADEEFLGAKLAAMLTFASGATRGAGNSEINAVLTRIAAGQSPLP